MKEHLIFQTSSQCFVHGGSWLSIFLLLENITCIRERWSMILSLVIWGWDNTKFPLHLLGPCGIWKNILSMSLFVYSCLSSKDIYWLPTLGIALKKVVSCPNLPCRWINWALPFLSRKLEHINKYLWYKYEMVNIFINVYNQYKTRLSTIITLFLFYELTCILPGIQN